MLVSVSFNGLLFQTMQPAINSAVPTFNQAVYARPDIIAAAIIGLLVVGWAVFALMCRYK